MFDRCLSYLVVVPSMVFGRDSKDKSDCSFSTSVARMESWSFNF